MYLSENVRAEIAGLLSEPSQYQEALQALANQYKDRVLLGKTITRKLSELPNVRSGDVKALDAYLLRLNEIIATMHRVKLVGEMFSPSVLEIAMGKLPNEMTEAWGEKNHKRKGGDESSKLERMAGFEKEGSCIDPTQRFHVSRKLLKI